MLLYVTDILLAPRGPFPSPLLTCSGQSGFQCLYPLNDLVPLTTLALEPKTVHLEELDLIVIKPLNMRRRKPWPSGQELCIEAWEFIRTRILNDS